MEDVKKLKIMVDKAYNEDNNYRILHTKSKSKNALIFFSGHGLYSNTKDFNISITKKQTYHGQNIIKNKLLQNYFSLIILARDIHQCHYDFGINSTLNTKDKVTEFLKNTTEGYEIVTAGSSAGGYMAVLAGIKLNAKRIYTFSGQFVENLKDYPSLLELVSKNNNIYYFYPTELDIDAEQYEFIKDFKNITVFPFDGDNHGVPFSGICLPKILIMNRNELLTLLNSFEKNKPINRFVFCKKVVPTIERIYKQSIVKIKKHIARLFHPVYISFEDAITFRK